MRLFVEADYQGGLACGGCGRWFRDGEVVHGRDAGELFGSRMVIPECARCHAGRGEQLELGAGEQLEMVA